MSDKPERFRADIEGMRAIAVIGVLVFHAHIPGLPGGFVGVDVFYVISGFLITQLMLRGVEGASVRGFLGDFYARRIRRILPAATLVLVATLAGALLVHNVIENVGVAQDARATTLFFSNAHFAAQASDYFAAGREPSPFLQYWSLSLEEQFYLVWPVLFFALFAFTRGRVDRRRTIGLVLGALAIASLALELWWMRGNASSIEAFYQLPARAWELAGGALLAVFEPHITRLPKAAAAVLGGVGLIGVVLSMALITDHTPFPGTAALFPTAGTAAMIAAGCGTRVGIYRLLSIRPMQLIGRYSFSLYLWHWPYLVLKVEHVKWLYASWPARGGSMAITSLIAAAATYHLVENPVRRAAILRGRTGRTFVVGAALISVGLVSSFAFERLALTALSTSRTVAATGGVLAPEIQPTDFVPKNLVPSIVDTLDRTYVHCGSPCLVGSSNAHHHILLFGNSHAGHWGAAFEAAAAQLDAQIEIHAPGACASFLIPVELLAAGDRDACESQRRKIFERVQHTHFDLIVLSNMTLDVFPEHRAEWERGVRAALRAIPRTSRVVVFSETPRTKHSVPLCLSHSLDHAERCDQAWPDAENIELRRITEEEGATFVDLRNAFCTSSRCPAITQDVLIYADTDHITVPFSRARGPYIAATIAPLLPRN